MKLPASVDETVGRLAAGDYIAERTLATAVFLTVRMHRSLFLEGEAGVGKTRDRAGARPHARTAARPPAMLRRARCGLRRLRVELPATDDPHPARRAGRRRRGRGHVITVNLRHSVHNAGALFSEVIRHGETSVAQGRGHDPAFAHGRQVRAGGSGRFGAARRLLGGSVGGVRRPGNGRVGAGRGDAPRLRNATTGRI